MPSTRRQLVASDIDLGEALHSLSAPARAKASLSGARVKEPAPFVKWAGGKRALLSQLIARLPATFGTYFEPFAGGGALFFAANDRITEAVLSDSNLELVITYNVIRRDPEELIGLLEEHTRSHNHDYYYRVRRQQGLQDPIKIAARFIYLNKTCYNGLYRVNKNGHFNVPIGRYAEPSVYDRDNILACHKALLNARIEYRDFETIPARTGDFVYCDPPYQPVAETASFTKYTSADFSETDQRRLRDFALKLHDCGVYVMMSNSDTLFVRRLYEHPAFKISTVQAPRFVNCKPDKRGAVNELVITTY
jgi:DNA adenine methylase